MKNSPVESINLSFAYLKRIDLELCGSTGRCVDEIDVCFCAGAYGTELDS